MKIEFTSSERIFLISLLKSFIYMISLGLNLILLYWWIVNGYEFTEMFIEDPYDSVGTYQIVTMVSVLLLTMAKLLYVDTFEEENFKMYVAFPTVLYFIGLVKVIDWVLYRILDIPKYLKDLRVNITRLYSNLNHAVTREEYSRLQVAYSNTFEELYQRIIDLENNKPLKNTKIIWKTLYCDGCGKMVYAKYINGYHPSCYTVLCSNCKVWTEEDHKYHYTLDSYNEKSRWIPKGFTLSDYHIARCEECNEDFYCTEQMVRGYSPLNENFSEKFRPHLLQDEFCTKGGCDTHTTWTVIS